jgi:hypothetical protein
MLPGGAKGPTRPPGGKGGATPPEPPGGGEGGACPPAAEPGEGGGRLRTMMGPLSGGSGGEGGTGGPPPSVELLPVPAAGSKVAAHARAQQPV